jgi:hypothetical protein
MFRIVVVAFTALIAATNVATADCLWSDGDLTNLKAREFIKRVLPPVCGTFSPALIRRSSSYQSDTARISVEVSMDINQACSIAFDKRLTGLKAQNKLLQCGANIANDYFFKDAISGGPVVIFYFRATPAELNDINKQ